jgi:hypothetical protein
LTRACGEGENVAVVRSGKKAVRSDETGARTAPAWNYLLTIRRPV